jgi:hypothetical protein
MSTDADKVIRELARNEAIERGDRREVESAPAANRQVLRELQALHRKVNILLILVTIMFLAGTVVIVNFPK